ncbi:MAG: sulfatase-like hydrolase/transferase [Bacteriovorax sp.]|jgi:arylsulfatase A-like enzyme
MKKRALISSTLIVLLLTSVYLLRIYKQKTTDPIVCADCNVIIVSLSNLRKKNMSFYGSSRNTTPVIDAFFKDSFSFDHAIAPASLTFSDAASFFFSLQTMTHKFMNRTDKDIALDVLKKYKSFPKVLAGKGYNTAAFVSDEDYKYENGIGAEFGLYFDKSKYEENAIAFQPWQYNVGTNDLVKPAVKWLRDNHKEKFFLFFQAYDMHCPYTPRGKFKELFSMPHNPKIDFTACYMNLDKIEVIKKGNKTYYKLFKWASFLNKEEDVGVLFEQRDLDYLIALYDAELANADDNLRELFLEIKNLKLEKNTIVIFMSEHGDYLGENGYFMKVAVTGQGNLHNANLSYPLMINYPPLKGAYKQKQMVQTIDFAPTILQMLGFDVPEGMQGKSFLKMLGNDQELNDYAFSAAIRKRHFRDKGQFNVQAVQNREWKYNFYEHRDFEGNVVESEENLYNLLNDPEEKIELRDIEKDKLTMMRKVRLEKRSLYSK